MLFLKDQLYWYSILICWASNMRYFKNLISLLIAMRNLTWLFIYFLFYILEILLGVGLGFIMFLESTIILGSPFRKITNSATKSTLKLEFRINEFYSLSFHLCFFGSQPLRFFLSGQCMDKRIIKLRFSCPLDQN